MKNVSRYCTGDVEFREVEDLLAGKHGERCGMGAQRSSMSDVLVWNIWFNEWDLDNEEYF